MAEPVNAARGEVSLKIDDVELVLAMTMNGLASLSTALQCKSLEDLWNRLHGVEVAATLAAIEFLTVKGDWAAAIQKVQLHHFGDCRVAIITLLADQLKAKKGNEDAVEDKPTKTAKK